MAKFKVASSWYSTLKSWAGLLRRLTFNDNFQGYEWEGTIPNGQAQRIVHDLGVTPTRFIVTYTETEAVVTSLSYRDVAYKWTATEVYVAPINDDFRGKILILP